jgi:beta propeller repeat protein
MGSLDTRRRRGGGRSGVLLFAAPLGLLCLVLTLFLALPTPASCYTTALPAFPIRTAIPGADYGLAISGKTVVWADDRDGDGENAIHGYNLATKKESPISTAAGDRYEPAISGNFVVWVKYNAVRSDDIYGCSLTTKKEFPICTAAGRQHWPAISGNIVVWEDDRKGNLDSDIYGYNLATGKVFPICTAAGNQECPAISGNTVVWQDLRRGAGTTKVLLADIYGYDLTTKKQFLIGTGAGAYSGSGYLAISGKTVVWQTYRNGSPSLDIYGYNLTTKKEFPICTAVGSQAWPKISGSTVVWQDIRAGNTFADADIYGYDLTTGTEFPVCGAAGGQSWPAISGTTVVWTDYSNGDDFGIYGATLADSLIGYIYDGHGTGRGNAVQDAEVELREAGTEEVLATDYTDKDGKFVLSYGMQPGTEYRVTVTLESEDGRLVMKRGGKTVSFSRDITRSSLDSGRLQIDCSDAGMIAEASMVKGDIDNCASVWHWLQLNRQVAKTIVEDLTDTLTVNVFVSDDQDTAAFYRQPENAIYLGAHLVDDDTADAYPPPWDFRKNRETHEFGHAMMNVVMSGGWVAEADVENHAGYVNANTGDSLSEGFAELWSMFADETAGITGDPDKYDGWGYLATVNRCMAWSPVNGAAPMLEPKKYAKEEFAAVGLLRKLQKVFGGGTTGFLKIVYNLPQDGDLTDFYQRLVAGGESATVLDPAFFSYGFFADIDGDWTHDTDEPVGAGNGAACMMLYNASVGPKLVKARPDRHDYPYDPDSFVVVNMDGVTGSDSESWVTVAVKHAGDPAADFSNDVLVTGAHGLVYVYLDDAATGVELTATGGDGVVSGDRISFSTAEWEAAQSAAVEDVAATQTFRVDRVTVGNPVAPRSVSAAKSCVVTATLQPRHTAGTFPVRIYKYRYVSGKWKGYGYVKARAADYSSYTKCSCKVRLPLAGKWRLRALAPADGVHRATWSRGYANVTVK